jgi:DNA repair photolyase
MCRYCFAWARARRFRQVKDAHEWATPRPLKFDAKAWRKKYHGTVACFGSHDITPANLPQCRAAIESLLQAGNRVLIVTKAHLECVQHLCGQLGRWREQVEFRVTIGSPCDSHLSYWEPGAPMSAERLTAAEHIHAAGYKLSFSMEPLLCDLSSLRALVNHVNPMADSIWIGKLNDVRRRVVIATPEDRRQVERIEAQQTDERILEIVAALKDDPKVRWKDSIAETVERHIGR